MPSTIDFSWEGSGGVIARELSRVDAKWRRFSRTLRVAVLLITFSSAGTLAQTALLGNQTLQSNLDSNAVGLAEAFPFSANASGQVTSINFFLDESSTATKIYVGIYSDSGGQPASLVTQGSTTQLFAGTWNSVAVTAAAITSGTSYWIAILGTSGGKPYFYDQSTTTCNSQTSSQSNLTSLPSTWSKGKSWNTCAMSAYAVAGNISATDVIGDQVTEGNLDKNAAGQAEAFPAVANTGGNVSVISVYIDATSGSGPVDIGLYADNGKDHPGTLLGQGSLATPAAGNWNQVSITASSVTAGSRYWIAILGQQATSPYFRDRQTTACHSETSSQTNLSSLPTTWSTGRTWSTCYISAYSAGMFVPPTITASASPSPNIGGWNNSTVTVTFACTAGSFPIQTCPSPVPDSTQGANQVISGTVVDTAGNTATAKVTLNIDLTAPTLSISSPANGTDLTASPVSVSGSVSDSLSGLASVACNGTAATIQAGSYSCSVPLSAGTDTISVQATDLAGNATRQSVTTTLIVPATISSFNPPSTSIGSIVTLQGSGFTQGGFAPGVTLTEVGGGTILAPISSVTATSISFVVPSGAASGPVTVTIDGLTATSSTNLSIISSSSFSLAAGPSAVTLLPGQAATIQVSLASSNGFSQLAALSLSGLPNGVTASFQPPQITAGQSSTLTLTAAASQNAGSSSLTITASATVQGLSEAQTAPVSLNVQLPTGSATFAGQVAVTGPYNTPLVGVTVSFTGTNYTGAQTGCTGSTTTDAAGNFVLNGLSGACVGSQMIQYDTSTVTSPPGKYSGVTLSYVLTQGQVTTPGIIVHLPNVSNAETFSVSQNSSSDQTFVSKSIVGLSITIYAGTTLSLADGTQPNPFPLSAVEIPYDQIPDYMPPNPTQDPVFAMSIEPYNSNSSQPVAITFPNRKNTPPGTTMPLTSLNPTLGMMQNYGTGTVSGNGTQVIPDPDPSNPGHLYGISHFDWHFPLPNPGPGPGPGGGGPGGGDPVDAATGILTLSKADVAIGGARGQIVLVRTYQEGFTGFRPFGGGTNHNYNWLVDMTFLSSITGASSLIGLVRPDGNKFPFSGSAGGVYASTSMPSVAGATMTTSQCVSNGSLYGCTVDLTWRNGTVYEFQPLLATQLSLGFLTSITDTNGNKITIVHDSVNPTLVDQIVDPVGRSITLSYNQFGAVSSVTDPIGRHVLYTYNTINKLASVTDLGGGTTTYSYNNLGQLQSITDARGIPFLQNTFDSNGRVIQQVAADGGTTTFSYTQLNPAVPTSPISSTIITDPLLNTTTYHFNASGVPVSVTDGMGQMTVYNVDPNTNLTDSIIDTLQRTTAFTYDPFGNTASITKLSGTSNAVTTNYTYGAFNRLASVTDAMGHATSYKYDNNGNLMTKIDALGHQTSYTYDSYGEPASVTDPLGNTTNFTYINGTLSTITDPLGNTTRRVTDAVARLTSVTTPLGNTTSYQYNNQDKITSVTNALSGSTTFTYDPNGNLLTVQDARQQGTNNKTIYTYDSMDRIFTRTDPLSRTESYSYDQNGNILTVTDRRGVVTKFQYDALNRRYFMGFGASGSSYQSTITYSYDAASRLYSVVDSSSGTIAPQFDGRDNLISETTPLGNISYGYDLAGRRINSTVNGQPSNTYTYDDANRLTKIVQGTGTTTFGHDNADRRTSITWPNGIVANYGYDNDSRVSSIAYQVGSNSVGNLAYQYDGDGRRTQIGGTLARTAFPSAVSSATYDAANELTNWNGTAISYDANGSVVNDGTAAYTWNARNQLVGRGSVTYAYDAYGRRIRSTSGRDLLYDGKDVTQEQIAGNPVANRSTGAMDEFFSRSDTTGTYTPLTDAMGTVLALANSSGQIVTQYTYDPFGNVTVSGTSSSNPFQFAGRENDGTGVYYNRARYYSPTLHRFVSRDPLGYAAGTNEYAYAYNNPISFRDGTGKSPCVLGALAGVILYNGYTVYSEISSAVNGRKGPNPGGWSGAWQILTGSANAALTGCAVADGAAALSDALGAGAEGAAEEAAENCGLCFPAQTPVRTRHGLIPIEQVKVGDEVLSSDPKSGRTEYKRVIALTKPHFSTVMELRSLGAQQTLRPTPEHPFFVRHANGQAGSWVRARLIVAGDQILTVAAGWQSVSSITDVPGEQTVYNFVVEDNHDYFVGDEGLLVHNSPCTRSQALREAKDANGIPRSAQPDQVIKPGTPEGDAAGLDERNVRQYEFTNSDGDSISIREDKPASYPDGGTQGPHFNSGPANGDGDLPLHNYWDE